MTVRIHALLRKKQQKQKICMLTAYDYPTAALLDKIKIDLLLVGDSIGNVFSGKKDTLAVTLDHIIYHCEAVSRAANHCMVVADLPFMSYHVSIEQAKTSAGRLIKEGGAHAVKAEVTPAQIPYIKAIVEAGIPVMAHIGFTPQYLHQLGGYKIQGKSEKAAELLLDLAKQVEQIGCFSILMELVPELLAKKITQSVSIPSIGIGAGPYCDGQVLVINDVLGLSESPPKFAKAYVDLKTIIQKAVQHFQKDVQTGIFPQEY